MCARIAVRPPGPANPTPADREDGARAATSWACLHRSDQVPSRSASWASRIGPSSRAAAAAPPRVAARNVSDCVVQDRAVNPARDLHPFGGSDGHAQGIERPLGLEGCGDDPIDVPPLDRPEEPRDLGRQAGRLRFDRPSAGPAGLAPGTPVFQGTHPAEVIRQGLVAGRQALRRVVLRILPAERPESQPLGQFEAGSGLNVRRPSPRPGAVVAFGAPSSRMAR